MGVFCDFQVCMTEKDERRTSVCELEFKLRVEFMGEFFFFTVEQNKSKSRASRRGKVEKRETGVKIVKEAKQILWQATRRIRDILATTHGSSSYSRVQNNSS